MVTGLNWINPVFSSFNPVCSVCFANSYEHDLRHLRKRKSGRQESAAQAGCCGKTLEKKSAVNPPNLLPQFADEDGGGEWGREENEIVCEVYKKNQ